MEHLHELILSGEDKAKNARMFGVLFEEPPTWNELVNGTPLLAPVFKFVRNESLLACPEGLEWNILIP